MATNPTQINNLQGPIYTLDQTGNGNFSGDVTIGTTQYVQIPQNGTLTLYSTDGQTISIIANSGAVNQMATLGQIGSTPMKDLGVADWTEDTRLWVMTGVANDAGVLWLTRYIPGYSYVLNNIWIAIAGQPSTGWTSGENFIGIYDNTGTLLSGSNDLSSQFATSKIQPCALQKSVPLTAGNEYFVGLVLNYTGTGMSLKATTAGSSMNGGLTAPHLRASTIGSGLTALPTSINLSTQSTVLLAAGKGSQGYLFS